LSFNMFHASLWKSDLQPREDLAPGFARGKAQVIVGYHRPLRVSSRQQFLCQELHRDPPSKSSNV
jgi:hypothetical protein